MYTQYIRGIDR